MDCDLMIVVKEHASTVRNRTGKVRFARAMPTTNPRTGMLWERDCWFSWCKVCFTQQPNIIEMTSHKLDLSNPRTYIYFLCILYFLTIYWWEYGQYMTRIRGFVRHFPYFKHFNSLLSTIYVQVFFRRIPRVLKRPSMNKLQMLMCSKFDDLIHVINHTCN